MAGGEIHERRPGPSCAGASSVGAKGDLSIRYSDRSTEAGIKASVDSAGDAYDKALAETTNGLYKTVVIMKRGP